VRETAAYMPGKEGGLNFQIICPDGMVQLKLSQVKQKGGMV
jgi:hypothetical protein